MPSVRLTNLLIFAICLASMLIVVFYMERHLGLPPCALCVTQRVFMVTIGLLALAAFIHNPKVTGRRVYAGLGVAAGIAGAYFAGHHMWLQSLPADQAPACGPSLGYIFDTFSFMDGLKVLLRGDGNCAEIQWRMPVLGLTIPGTALVGFIALILVNIWQFLRRQ